jgi:cytoskeletal protein CcmA (bactofilin family)
MYLKNDIELAQLDYSVIGKNLSIKGELNLPHSLQVFGHITGNIFETEKVHLVIHKTSVIEGEIKVSEIDIFGKVNGSIEAETIVVFHPGSEFNGKINAKNIKIYPGAIVESTMQGQGVL